jgi:uncharacterized membrane protein YvbJ
MERQCPVCGLYVPSKITQCECGYDFNIGQKTNIEQKTVTQRNKRPIKKKGGAFLAVGVSLLLLSLIMYYAFHIQGGILFGLVNLGMVCCLLIGIIRVIAGFIKKA